MILTRAAWIRVGRAGVEKQHDRDLRGSAGAVQLEVNALGRVIRELDRQEGVPGEEVGLTIDVALQQTVLGRLGDQSASCVVLDCRNGEVLAMGTNPSFDPALFNAGVAQAQWTAWAQDKRTPLLNRAAAGVYAPGSTFKMAVAMAGLESRIVSPGDAVHCPGYLDLGNARFHCWRQGGHGTLDLRGGLKNSCDVYFYETARRVGIDRIAAMAHRFGLGTELAIDLPGRVPASFRRASGASVRAMRGTPATRSCRASVRGIYQVTPFSLRRMPRASPPAVRCSRI